MATTFMPAAQGLIFAYSFYCEFLHLVQFIKCIDSLLILITFEESVYFCIFTITHTQECAYMLSQHIYAMTVMTSLRYFCSH